MENNIFAGQKYKASLNIKWQPLLITLSIGLIIAVGVGRIYAKISSINPYIYLNIILLILTLFLLLIVPMSIISFTNSKNKTVNILIILLIYCTSWLSHWAQILNDQNLADIHSKSSFLSFWHYMSNPFETIVSIGDYALYKNISVSSLRTVGRDNLELTPAILIIAYIIEFILFLLPAYIISKRKSYYCEECNSSFVEKKGYVIEKHIFYQKRKMIQEGDLAFLEAYTLYQNLDLIPLDPKLKPEIIQISMYGCTDCNNAIVNINITNLEYDEENKRETGVMDNYIIEDTYITKESKELLQLKLW